MIFERPLSFSDSAGLAQRGEAVSPDGAGLAQAICFTPGTMIATPQGGRTVETLVTGDLVVTRDHGLQPLRWIGQCEVAGQGHLAPITFAAGSLTGLERPLTVSPHHRILLRSAAADLYFGETEVLVAAVHLLERTGSAQRPCTRVRYIHLLFDHHEIVYAEGAACESFHPGDAALGALDAKVRQELFSLFPDLRQISPTGGRTARRCLRRHEALALQTAYPNQLR